jgi:REP element-mobilizing transposase RayT
MVMNEAGYMIKSWYHELEKKFPKLTCHEMIVMPNHVHAIIEIGNMSKGVGADLRVCPPVSQNQSEFTNGFPINNDLNMIGYESSNDKQSETRLDQIVQWFKTMTTNEYIRYVKESDWLPFHGKLWQRNYWEHIIRSEEAYYNISQYIKDNPKRWESDELNDYQCKKSY